MICIQLYVELVNSNGPQTSSLCQEVIVVKEKLTQTCVSRNGIEEEENKQGGLKDK